MNKQDSTSATSKQWLIRAEDLTLRNLSAQIRKGEHWLFVIISKVKQNFILFFKIYSIWILNEVEF